jgi:hypothetical protein
MSKSIYIIKGKNHPEIKDILEISFQTINFYHIILSKKEEKLYYLI